jgi:hydrogenase-4 component B
MSLLTFTKTFGVIFLGNPREELHHEPKETPFIMHLPQYFIVAAMLSIAIVPQFYFNYVSKVVISSLAPLSVNDTSQYAHIMGTIAGIGKASIIFIGLLLLIFILRWLVVQKRAKTYYETWGCGYVAPVKKAQYTERSFARSFGSLLGFLVHERKNFEKIPKSELYPEKRIFSTHYFDIFEKYLITPIARRVNFTVNYFQFIQNGQIQSYVIYGIFFMVLVFLGTIFNLIN